MKLRYFSVTNLIMARCSCRWTFPWNNDGHHHGHPTSSVFLPQSKKIADTRGSDHVERLNVDSSSFSTSSKLFHGCAGVYSQTFPLDMLPCTNSRGGCAVLYAQQTAEYGAWSHMEYDCYCFKFSIQSNVSLKPFPGKYGCSFNCYQSQLIVGHNNLFVRMCPNLPPREGFETGENGGCLESCWNTMR